MPTRLGIDVGSTTAKVILLDADGDVCFSAYRRHDAQPVLTLREILTKARGELGDVEVSVVITGSAGMGISERFGIPFVQEVISSAEVVRQRYPEVKTLVDIGGEDAKMIFFNGATPDIRMNGACAGGTGAFIDEMSDLLGVNVAELDQLARDSTCIYPIASRCGVFAKTDVQNLLSRDIPRTDLAASVFHAVVLRTLATLARGYDSAPPVLFCGGPLTFLPSLKQAFVDVLDVNDGDVLHIEEAHLLPALGAALAPVPEGMVLDLSDLLAELESNRTDRATTDARLPRLFGDEKEYAAWEAERLHHRIDRVDVADIGDGGLFLGIDSGSTTTKIVLIDDEHRVVFDYYASNGGDAIGAVQSGLDQLRLSFQVAGKPLDVSRSMVTGYGEDLIRAAFGLDGGMVETLAHYRAAREFDEDVSFIIDIGGQDMKAIFVKDGRIQDIKINEACSSGCGSFIESLARGLGYCAAEFGREATTAEAPCDLGTRCTVFMNSKVKQALREGAAVSDISAGLAYSVIKNALHKVLSVTDTDELGEHIVVQGGTFRNPAVHRAFEKLLEREVICPDLAELMGAYGAALTALDVTAEEGPVPRNSFPGNFQVAGNYAKRNNLCRGCENRCTVTKMTFPNGNVFYSGNRCERIYSNGGRADRRGENLPATKLDLLFNRTSTPDEPPLLTLGIPRVLNQFDNFPFWNTLFVESGIRVQLSAPSSNEILQQGTPFVMSENLCFPAKLVSGHIIDLANQGVDRIFYPMVFYEKTEFVDAANTYNCPIVSGYPDVVNNAIDPGRRYGIPLDMPDVTFRDEHLLRKACVEYLVGLGVSRRRAGRSYAAAIEEQERFKKQLRRAGAEVFDEARREGRPVILLMGRPYHIDPLINHNIPELIADFGLDVITEDSVPWEEGVELTDAEVLTQWEYMNRYFHAARWVGETEGVELVQLNSFGCGPDPFIIDEVAAILEQYGKRPTVIRIDEIESAGSVKLRLRSTFEALASYDRVPQPVHRREPRRVYEATDRHRTLIVPDINPFCSPPILRPLIDQGYEIIWLPPPDRESVDVGLKYLNNEVCYPATITAGDIIKTLQTGDYDLAKTAVGFSQTGGQCRASSYVPLITKALKAAGFDIPVVTVSSNVRTLNDQPGFEFSATSYSFKALISMPFFDSLAEMYYSTAVREVHKGESQAVIDRYVHDYMSGEIPIKKREMLDALERAVAGFNAIEVDAAAYPKVGLVGEIFVKYNPFANNHVAEWLMDHGLEVVVPPFHEFFARTIVDTPHRIDNKLQRRDLTWAIARLGRRPFYRYLDDFQDIMGGYRRSHRHSSIETMASGAEQILSISHQYGESWLIAGEVADFVNRGINNVLCLQPFGCIANHVIAKGAEKKMKQVHPQLNILFLDTDAGTSEVNFFNRLHFFVDHAKNGAGSPARPKQIPLAAVGDPWTKI